MQRSADTAPPATSRKPVSWPLCLVGLFIAAFALVALSGPGRIDIDDGQLRFEVAQNLVDHGEPTIRDPDLWFTVLPGRGGKRYTMCRFPHSVLGVGAILVADATGPVSEARRHFYFSLIGAAVGAGLAMIYAVWFRRLGWTPRAALAWASAGLLCTPSWYYATSTFDDLLGSAAVVGAMVIAFLGRGRLTAAAVSGLLIGLAFNCKQPLGLFVVPVLAGLYVPGQPLKKQLRMALLALAGVGFGLMLYAAYEWYKFPPETRAAHVPILEKWKPTWTSNPLPALLGLIVSPGAGCIWYCPPVLLGVCGWAAWYRREKLFCLGVAVALGAFFLFICALAPFKGDMSWGPRYLSPIFAVLWLFVPAVVGSVRRWVVATVLAAGLLVQVLGLSVDPHRLYLERKLWSRFYVVNPWLYFHPAIAHLFNRPREIIEIVRSPRQPGEPFTPARSPTYCLPILEWTPGGRAAVHRYRIFNSLRPWWLSQQHLPPAQRPVDLERTLWLLLGVGAGGAVLVVAGSRSRKVNPPVPDPGSPRPLAQRADVAAGHLP